MRRSLADPPEVNETVGEVSCALGPDGEIVTDTLTVALNPFRLARDRVTVPEEDRGILIVDVLAAREKSGASLTMTRTVVEWDSDVEFPVMVTV